jgi:hypothetical protein
MLGDEDIDDDGLEKGESILRLDDIDGSTGDGGLGGGVGSSSSSPSKKRKEAPSDGEPEHGATAGRRKIPISYITDKVCT